jgi:hypothetical protein
MINLRISRLKPQSLFGDRERRPASPKEPASGFLRISNSEGKVHQLPSLRSSAV